MIYMVSVHYRLLLKMASSIKLFQSFQKCHQIIGIYPSHPNRKQYAINWGKTIYLIGCTEWMLTTAAFLAFDVKSMFDGGLAFSILTAAIKSFCIYFSLILQLENTLKFIAMCEGFIEKSELLVLSKDFCSPSFVQSL